MQMPYAFAGHGEPKGSPVKTKTREYCKLDYLKPVSHGSRPGAAPNERLLYWYNYISYTMDTFVTVARKWGNSKGVVLPKRLGVEAGEEILLTVQRTKGVAKVKDFFGKLKKPFKNTARALREIDTELDSEL